jgi:hypothetical protein
MVGSATGFQVVDGGEDDPFTQKDPAITLGSDGKETQTGQAGKSSQADAGLLGKGAGQEKGTGAEADEGDGGGDDTDLDAYFAARLRQELPKIQSGWDRQNQLLKSQLEEQRTEMSNLQRSIREGQLSQLSQEDQAKLRSQWDAEDAKKDIDHKLKATDDFFFNTYAFSVLTRFTEFGVTEEELLACESVEDMDKLALGKKADYFEALAKGKTPEELKAQAAQSAQKKAPAGGKSKAPAGSSARTDIGGGGAPDQQRGLLTDQGMSSMSENIKSMFGKPGSFG